MKLDEIIINDEVSKELVDLYSQKSIDNLFSPIINLGVKNTILQKKLVEKIEEIKKDLNTEESQEKALIQARKNVLKLFNNIERKILKRKDNYVLYDNELVSDNIIYNITMDNYLEIIITDKKIIKKKDENIIVDNFLVKIYFSIDGNNLKLDTVFYDKRIIKELFNLIHFNHDIIFFIITENMRKEILRNFNILRLSRSLINNDDFESDEDIDGDDYFSDYGLLNKVIDVDNYIMNDFDDYYKKILSFKDSLALEKDYILNLLSIEDINDANIKYDNYMINM